jgi:two-component system, NtrC family, response regulator HydG
MVQPPAPGPPPPRERENKVLIADDDLDLCEVLKAGLEPRGFRVETCQSAESALAWIDREDFSTLLVDIHMEGANGLELCRDVVAKRPNLPVIVVTGFGTLEHAVGAIRAGAYDFITKPVSTDALVLTLDRAVQYRALTQELQRLRQRAHQSSLPNIIGSSEQMRQLAALVARVAESDTSVLINGESGTGKELVARALHEASGRSGPFLAINCAAVPENLLESELFGHARGAFTDASVARSGLFVEANDGTLFLDEIGDMPLAMQSKLLRALQERKVRALGASKEVPFNARLLTATNRDLEQAVQEKQFREDLFYRINVVKMDVPPLRRRGNDVLELAQFFLDRAGKRSNKPVSTIGRQVAERLLSYDWPGNVRELENCIERSVALAQFETITLDDLPPKVREHRATEVYISGSDPADLPSMTVVEDRYIRKVLSAVGDNKTLAAKILGFDRRTLYRKLRQPSED